MRMCQVGGTFSLRAKVPVNSVDRKAVRPGPEREGRGGGRRLRLAQWDGRAVPALLHSVDSFSSKSLFPDDDQALIVWPRKFESRIGRTRRPFEAYQPLETIACVRQGRDMFLRPSAWKNNSYHFSFVLGLTEFCASFFCHPPTENFFLMGVALNGGVKNTSLAPHIRQIFFKTRQYQVSPN